MTKPHLPTENKILAVPCSPFFQKVSSTAGVRVAFSPVPICKIDHVYQLQYFVPSWDEVKSVWKPCRFITSSFIFRQRHAPMEEYLLFFLVSGRQHFRRHDSHDRYDGYFGDAHAAVIPHGENTL